MYDQTGSTDSSEGFNPYQGGFNSGSNYSQYSQGFDPNQYESFKKNFSGFSNSGNMGFEDLFGNIFGNDRNARNQPQQMMLAMEVSFSDAVNGATKVQID